MKITKTLSAFVVALTVIAGTANGQMENITLGVSGGAAEPWSDLGGNYATGFLVNVYGQYDLSEMVAPNLMGELSVGLETHNEHDPGEGSSSIIPILLNGVYDLSETVSLPGGIAAFIYGGVGLYLHSFDSGNGADPESQTVFGVNGGIGGSHEINEQIAATLRVGGLTWFTSSLVEGGDDFSSLSTPILVGISYHLK